MPPRYYKSRAKKSYERPFIKKSSSRSTTYRRTAPSSEYKSSGHGRLLVTPSGTNMPLPQRLKTKFTCALNGVFASGGVAQRLYNIKLNGLLTPFNPSTSGGSIAWEGPFVPLANIDPAGLSILSNAVTYTQYRCFGSAVKITVLPESLSDVSYISITPSTTISLPATYSNAIAQPYTKQKTFSSSKNMGSGNSEWLTNYISVSRLMGVPPRAVQDDVSLVYSAIWNADPSDIMYWVVNFCQSDNVAPSAVTPYTVVVTYYVELFGLATASLPQ